MNIFIILAFLINIYAVLCAVRIFLTWIPQINYSKVGNILSNLCDPYLRLFQRFRFLRIGMLDFSPAVAIIVLGIIGMVVQDLGVGKVMGFSTILIVIISLIWQLIKSLLCIAIIILLIRLCSVLIYKNYDSTYWSAIDNFFMPKIFSITKLFFRSIRFEVALVLGIVMCILMIMGLHIIVGLLCFYIKLLNF